MNILQKILNRIKPTNANQIAETAHRSIPKTPEENFIALTADERVKAIMSLGDTGQIKYYDLLKFAITHDNEIDVVFSALKRIHLFADHPNMLYFLKYLNNSPDNEKLEPYLSSALSRVGIISIEEFNNRINNSDQVKVNPVQSKWGKFGNGFSIGTTGSEGGKIIQDDESIDGARITLEKDGNIAPFSITLGIYGLLFHTIFVSTEEQSRKIIITSKKYIDEIFSMHDIPEVERNSKWDHSHNYIISKLTEP